jgi:hypothetical protein
MVTNRKSKGGSMILLTARSGLSSIANHETPSL